MKELKTWSERIMVSITGRTNKGSWFTHGGVIKAMMEYENKERSEYPKTGISAFIERLIRSGHIERARKPKELYEGRWLKQEYIYRWTGREYRKSNRWARMSGGGRVKAENVAMGNLLYRMYPRLPRWYRRMMM